MEILNRIHSPEDVNRLSPEETNALCEEIRAFLVKHVSKTGGHLASNLGVVELTVAIHRVFDTSKDRLVFDVGHQSYVHKILTGRRDGFNNLRQYGGIAGFPKPSESEHDAFIAGHASESISVALGMARARTLKGEKDSIIALIGDGSLTGGMAYEALSDAGASKEPLIVILNDNGMAIARNVGGISRHLAKLRAKRGYISFKKAYRRFVSVVPFGGALYRVTHNIKKALKGMLLHCSMFEDMGFRYLGPVDGHDVEKLTETLTWAKEFNEPVLLHVITQKGKGYLHAERDPDKYHGVSRFDPQTGSVEKSMDTNFSAVFGMKMVELAKVDRRICGITAAMVDGTGLADFAFRFPKRFFDVGIAEEHGAAMAAGMAKKGLLPVFAVYSTFLQRSYDLIMQDVAIEKNHVVFGVDRAGLVGEDGETHHGVFDVAYLCSVPGMTIMAPASYRELEEMLEFAIYNMTGPVAIRYPRGSEGAYKSGGVSSCKVCRTGKDFTIVTYGTMINTAEAAASALEKLGISVEILKLGVINPIPLKPIFRSVEKTRRIMVLEEVVSMGSIGEQIGAALTENGIFTRKVILQNLGSEFITHGSREKLRQLCGIDTETVVRVIEGACKK